MGLECKDFGCTADNVSNVTNAIDRHMYMVHLPCTRHSLQLSTEWGYQEPFIAWVLVRYNKLAQDFHKSTKLTYGLRVKQRLLSDRGQSLELIQSCPTRWGSTFFILEWIKCYSSQCMQFFSINHTTVADPSVRLVRFSPDHFLDMNAIDKSQDHSLFVTVCSNNVLWGDIPFMKRPCIYTLVLLGSGFPLEHRRWLLT